MATRRRTEDEPSKTRRPPARTPEGQEQRLVAAASDLAYEQLLQGNASSQVITHFLKLGTQEHRLQLEKLRHENRLLEAKREQIASQARVEELYTAAIDAMSIYKGEKKVEKPS